MDRVKLLTLVLASLTLPFLLAMRAAPNTLYLPVIIRMPPPGPSLFGIVFFDYNGSGLQEQGEPGIPNVLVSVDSPGNHLHAVTGVDGSYYIPNVPPGQHQVYVQSPKETPATAFRYINVFKGWVDIPAYEMNGVHVPAQHLPDTEIQTIEVPCRVTIASATGLEVALMQGYLTHIFAAADFSRITKGFGYDLDPMPGRVRDYSGSTTLCTDPSLCNTGTGDGHGGWDWGSFDDSIIGIPIRAPAPGTVNWASQIEVDPRLGLIKHVTLEHLGMTQKTGCGHHSALVVQPRQSVYRGQIVALLGKSGSSWAHVHFNCHPSWNLQTGEVTSADPFRDVTDQTSASWWTKDNDPQFPLVSLGE